MAEKTLKTEKRLVYTAGRPPWYNSAGEIKDAFVIGIAGASASGKTTVANEIIRQLDVPWVTLLSMDSFYKVLDAEELEQAHNNDYDFDSPTALDIPCLRSTLARLKDGKKVEVPVYDFSTHSRSKQTITMYGASVIIFEGILAFTDPAVCALMDLKVFVDEDADICLARRLKRDTESRGRELTGALKQYHRFVKPSFDHHIKPSMQHADIVIPRGASNTVAMDLLVRHVIARLDHRAGIPRQPRLGSEDDAVVASSVHLLPATPLVNVLHTSLRDRTTDRERLVFDVERLSVLVVEHAVALLPPLFPAHHHSHPSFLHSSPKVCGVSVVRAGLAMEAALCAVVPAPPLGRLLIHHADHNHHPQLHYCRLPPNVSEFRVFLLDGYIATGAAAIMAVRVLLDHDVPEENITVITLLGSKPGVNALAYAFPKLTIVASALDDTLDDNGHIRPGFGNLGDRFFGTALPE